MTHHQDTATPGRERPTYGNWVLVRAPGLFGHGPIPTAILLGTPLAAMIAVVARGLIPGVVIGLLGIAAYVVVGTPAGSVLVRRTARSVAVRRGTDLHLRGATTGRDGNRLPGLLARTRVLLMVDPSGRPFVVLAHPRDLWTVVAVARADNPALASRDHLDARVGGFARLLAAAGAEPGLVCLKTITDTTPADGIDLTLAVTGARAGGSPAIARAVMDECANAYPVGTFDELTWVEVTFRGRTLAPSGDEAAVLVELARRVPGLLERVADAGAGHVQLATPDDIVSTVGDAYSPGSPGDDAAWEKAGPSAAVEAWASYRHDTATSITWELDTPPRAAMTELALAPLLAPIPGLARKRVAILHCPDDPDTSARRAENDAQAAVFAAAQNTRGRVTAASTGRVRATEQARHEIAAGAVLDRFTLLVTATVTDGQDIEAMASAVEAAAGSVPLRLRRCYATQAAAFATTLPIGFLPNEHTLIPQAIRDLT
jgi:hypothetical protein